jgi:lipopolysaccharide export system permease protein
VVGGRLDRYVLRRFLQFYGLALLYLVGLFLVVDLVTRLDRFLEAKAYLADAGRTVPGAVLAYYTASLPLLVLQVAPFVTVMGACMAVVDLRRWNELYPMMEAGRSVVRILAPVTAFSVLVTFALVVAQDRLAPRSVEARLRIERDMEKPEDRAATHVPHVRDGAGNVWSIGRWDPTSLTAEQVRVVPFRAGGKDYDALEVPRMRFLRGRDGVSGWFPEGGTLLPQGERPGGDTSTAVPRGTRLPTDLAPADVELARASEDLEGLSSGRLRRLRDRYPGLHYLSVLLHRRITYPLSNLVLLLVGVPLVLRGQGASLFLSVLAALAVCAGYFVTDTVACDFGGRGVLPAGVATWLATILFGAAGIAMMDAVHGHAPAR